MGRRAALPRLAIGPLVMLLAIPFSSCGDSGSSTQPQVDVGPHIDAPIQLADCNDWQQADAEERLGTIRQIRQFSGGPVGQTPGRGAILDDERAYELIDGYCRSPIASAFKLYRIYGRAAAFEGH